MARNGDGIRWLNDIHGTPNGDDSGYHETLTLFWLKRVWNFIDSRVGHTDLFSLANDVIANLSRELLFSAEALRDYYPRISLDPH